MDDQMNFLAGFEQAGNLAIDEAADALADSITGALSDAVSDAVSDPLVLSVMTADKIDPHGFEAMLRKMAAKLAHGRQARGRLCSC